MKQETKQQTIFSQTMANHLSVLQMNKTMINLLVSEICEKNPVISIKENFVPWKNNKSTTILPDIIENTLQQEKNLFDSLREELILDIEENDYPLLYLIIGNLDQHGFLPLSSEKLCKDTTYDITRVEYLRKKIRESSYKGLGTENSQEYMLFMIENLYGFNSIEYRIGTILLKYKKRSISPCKLAMLLKEPENIVIQSLNKLKSIQTTPMGERKITVFPDFIVKIEENKIHIIESNYVNPKITINTDHLGNKYTKKEITTFLKEARTLKQALERRTEGLQKHAEALILLRSDYFFKKSSDQQIIGLKEIAEITNRHISTVSRALRGRYFLFEDKIIPFSELWTHKIGNTSDYQVKKMIQELIDKEDKCAPLSDLSITNILQKKNIEIARRTVTKYREQLDIGTTFQRIKPIS